MILTVNKSIGYKLTSCESLKVVTFSLGGEREGGGGGYIYCIHIEIISYPKRDIDVESGLLQRKGFKVRGPIFKQLLTLHFSASIWQIFYGDATFRKLKGFTFKYLSIFRV